MKFLIFFALAFARVTPKDLHSRMIEYHVKLENEGRIVNGHKAIPAQFRYMVGLMTELEFTARWCGASLIGKEWVLSAAHCTIGASLVRVYLGATERECPEKFHDVLGRFVFTHPLFNPALKVNDICLIKIPETNESSKIGYIKIPNNAIDKYHNESVFVAGWGLTRDNTAGPADDLHYAILKVSPGEICSKKYGVLFSDDARICVATPNKVSTCSGDSGGPLVLERENLQIGVNSFGNTIRFANKDPIVFTRVSAYHVWIFARSGIGS